MARTVIVSLSLGHRLPPTVLNRAGRLISHERWDLETALACTTWLCLWDCIHYSGTPNPSHTLSGRCRFNSGTMVTRVGGGSYSKERRTRNIWSIRLHAE